MNNNYCEVCMEYCDGYTTTIELSDDRNKIQITGHDRCVNELYIKIKNLKDLSKKPVDKVLKEIKFKKE